MVNIRHDTTEIIENPRILIPEDDVTFVSSQTNSLKLTNCHHMAGRLNVFSIMSSQ